MPRNVGVPRHVIETGSRLPIEVAGRDYRLAHLADLTAGRFRFELSRPVTQFIDPDRPVPSLLPFWGQPNLNPCMGSLRSSNSVQALARKSLKPPSRV